MPRLITDDELYNEPAHFDDYEDYDEEPDGSRGSLVLKIFVIVAVIVLAVGLAIFLWGIFFSGVSPNSPASWQMAPELAEGVSAPGLSDVITPLENATKPTPMSGLPVEDSGGGVTISMKPTDMTLRPSEPFGIKVTVKIDDTINTNIGAIGIERISTSLMEALKDFGYSDLRFNEVLNVKSGSPNIEPLLSYYEVTNFAPGDEIEFLTYFTCPEGIASASNFEGAINVEGIAEGAENPEVLTRMMYKVAVS